MEESKFINKETEGYALSKLGGTSNQRLTALELDVQNLSTYLSATDKYLSDLEQYQNQNNQENDKRYVEFIQIKEDLFRNLNHLRNEANTKIKTILILAISAVGLSLGMGAALWLIK